MYCKIYINVLIFLCLIYFILSSFVKIADQHTDMQMRQCFECLWGMPMNANEEMLAVIADDDSGAP